MEARKLLRDEVTPGVPKTLAEALVRKWNKPVGASGKRLLEDIDNPVKRYTTAILLENTARGLQELKESGSITSNDIQIASRFVFPLVRRVWPGLIANEVVSVQPMSMPVGAICYLRVLYGTTKGGTSAGTEIPLGPGGTATLDKWYSSEVVNNETVGTGDGSNDTFGLHYFPVRASTVTVRFKHTNNYVATDDGAGNLKLANGTTVGTIDYTTGTIVFGASYVPDNNSTVSADYRYNMELNTQIPEINIDINFEEIRAQTRKLRVTWSPEMMEDLKAVYTLDAEAELIQFLSSEISLEIDQEIITDLYNAVSTSDPDLYATWDRTPSEGVPDLWHIKSLMYTIAKVSSNIHKRTFRAPANWIIVSNAVYSVISCLDEFQGEGAWKPGELVPATGIHRVGTLDNRWTVYVNPFFQKGDILLGYKGSVFYDTGYVYAPYIPLQATPTFYDPTSFRLVQGLRTRYNKKLVRAEYYGRITVENI